MLVDQKSTNGTYVNGRRLSAPRPRGCCFHFADIICHWRNRSRMLLRTESSGGGIGAGASDVNSAVIALGTAQSESGSGKRVTNVRASKLGWGSIGSCMRAP